MQTERAGEHSRVPVTAPLEPDEETPATARAEGAPRRARVVSTTSVERGRAPRPGAYFPPFVWPNVVEAPPPRRSKTGRSTFVLYHAMDLDLETRISYSTLITVDPGRHDPDPTDDTVRVDSRISVQNRFFLDIALREAQFMEQLTARGRHRLISNLQRQRRFANSLPYDWMNRGMLAAIRGQGRVGLWAIDAVRRTSHSAVHFPDEFITWVLRAWTLLSDRFGRQGLAAGMKDPRTLTNEQKSVVLLLSTSIILGSIFLLNNLILLFPKFGASPELQGSILAGYSQLVSTFMWGVATAVLLPFPPSEVLALNAHYKAGPALAFIAITTSKIVGAWLVFFIGDALNEAIRQQTEGKPRLERLVGWMNTNSEKYGFWILAFFTAMPFLPDTLALYVFAVSGIRFREFIWGTAIGTAVRYAGILGVAAFLGQDALSAIPGL